jgi:hypothetical protein
LCDAVLPKAPADNGTTLQITCKRPAERQENRIRRLKRGAACKTGTSLILAGVPTSDMNHPLKTENSVFVEKFKTRRISSSDLLIEYYGIMDSIIPDILMFRRSMLGKGSSTTL